MGTVYLARDHRSGQMVALKVLPPGRAREEERLLARFRREMEMCQRVSHPHLAWTYEVGAYRGVYYIAMEYIPGRSLYRVVQDDGPLPVPRLARLFAEVALALDHAHTQGLIHRDLKPSNIVVTPHDHAKVLDLGLALMQGEGAGPREVIGGQGYVVGTMDYIAPEQTDDPSKVDARCDVYALGCTMYFALTGRPPFPGGTSKEKIFRHRGEEPEPLAALNPAVPPQFAALVQRMMVKDPAGRMESAALVRHELMRWADKGPGLPLDQPEDSGYRQSVEQLEACEPSAEMVAEAIPAAEEPSPEPSPEPGEPEAPEEPVAAPASVPAPPRPRRRPAPRVMKEEETRRPERQAAPLWLFYAVPIAAGALLGGLVLALAWWLMQD
jgi:serine/threonine protein kinase